MFSYFNRNFNVANYQQSQLSYYYNNDFGKLVHHTAHRKQCIRNQKLVV